MVLLRQMQMNIMQKNQLSIHEYSYVMSAQTSNAIFQPQAVSEEAEIEAAKSNPESFAVLYSRYYENIFRYLYRRLDSKDLAADLCAQVFLKAITHLDTYRYKGIPFICWLYRIAGNELKQLFRNESRHRTLNIESSGIRELIEDFEEPVYEAYYEKMVSLLPLLPDADLQMIEMRYFEKRPFKEIGEILDITENNAKVRLYRILEKMKKSLLNPQK